MYCEFFGFSEKPFSVTPNTRFLYWSPQHEGVIKALEYGIAERKGFLLLSGEVGTGKTTSLRALLGRLDPQVETSLILNPLLSTVELIQTINRDFGCKAKGRSIKEESDALNKFLLKTQSRGKTALVVIDEAQNLSLEALEMTRLLSNLETETQKLLQILLVGQPELEEKLETHELRQLSQRIQIRCFLKPLDATQTERYILFRLHKAGPEANIRFERRALDRLYRVSGGVPRLINTYSDLALLAAYTQDTHVITARLIDAATCESQGKNAYVDYS